MSTIAATMPVLAALAAIVPAGPAPQRMTAREMLVASRAATSIGVDPCRAGGGEAESEESGGGEIVICGQRESPYALPGYDPLDRYSADARAGGSRTAMTDELKTATSPCATGGAFCLPPPTVNLFQALPVIVKGIKRLIEGDD